MNTFPKMLKFLRKKHGLKAEDFATIGISRSMIFAYEKGTSKPSLEKVLAIAEYFKVSIDYLVGRNLKNI